MFSKLPFADSDMRLLVELSHVTPRVWRRLIVPAAAPLDALHDILQVAFGWTDSHLHDFSVGDIRFGMANIESELLVVDERAAPLHWERSPSRARRSFIATISAMTGSTKSRSKPYKSPAWRLEWSASTAHGGARPKIAAERPATKT